MPDFQSLLGKAKAKAESFAKQHNIPVQFPGQSSQQNQQYQNNQYPPPNNYQQQPGQFAGNAYQPPNNYNQQQGYYPPPNSYPQGYPNQPGVQQQQAYPPQNYQTPPPQGFNPPPIPPNKPGSTPRPTIYWQPNLSTSVPVSANFKHQTGAHGWGNNELQNYIPDPANSFHTPDNKLVLRAISQNGQYTSARLSSLQTLSKQRGSLVTVVSPPCAPGIWPALWLLPNEPFEWPGEGEFDILETWNADNINHSCVHWGHFNGEDHQKHRAVETHISDMSTGRPIKYEFVWQQDESAGRNTGGGRLVFYIDDRAVMKAEIPAGTRRMSDWQITINIAMGGNVCQGKTPANGYYDMVIHELRLVDEPTGGWGRFESDWNSAPLGHH